MNERSMSTPLVQASLSARAGWAANAPIAALMQQALDNPELISLAAGFVDVGSLPATAALSAVSSLLSHPQLAQSALQYGSVCGDTALRELLLQRLLAQDAADPQAPRAPNPASLEQVVLSAGSNQLLAMVADALLDPGDCVVCDGPSYFVFTGLVESVGARCLAVAADADGMRVDALEQLLAAHASAGTLERIKAIYTVSYFDNPRGVSLARDRRAALVALAERYSRAHRIYVIEDAAYRELRFSGLDQASVRAYDTNGETVIYAGTFSKTFSPGLRVGFGVLPKSLAPAVSAIKGNIDFGSPYLNQCILAQALRLGLYEPHVERLRALYARKAQCMLAALDEQLAPLGVCSYERPSGGLYIWLSLPSHVNTGPDGELFARARAAGVLYVPGQYCYPSGPEQSTSGMRLSFGVQSEERIQLGVQKLAVAIADVVGG